MTSKNSVRDFVKFLRNLYPQNLQQKFSYKICQKILNLTFLKSIKKIACYFPKKGEVDITFLINSFLKEGKEIFLPKTFLEKKEISFFRLYTLDELVEGVFGIKEPPQKNPQISPEELELIIVPGVAFDFQKNRVGYGGGYFDRFLIKTRAYKIAPAFDFQIFNNLPVGPNDVKMDLIITSRFYIF